MRESRVGVSAKVEDTHHRGLVAQDLCDANIPLVLAKGTIESAWCIMRTLIKRENGGGVFEAYPTNGQCTPLWQKAG